MKMFLIGKGLWEIVDGTETIAETAGPDLQAKFKKRDNLALATICLGINSDLHIYVRTAKTGKEAWEELSKRFEEKTLSKKIEYRKLLYKSYMRPGSDMITHINYIKTISEHLEAVDDPVVEKDLVMILLSSWPPEYNNLITTLETLSEDKLTWNYVRDRALTEYDRIKGNRNKDGNSKDNALNTTNLPGKGRGRGRGKNGVDKRVCHRCKEVGHIVRNCPKKPEKKEPDNANANLVIVDNVDDAEYALVSEVMGQFDDANDDNDMDNSLATPAPCNYDSESLITGTSVRHESVPLETTKGPIDDIDIVIDDSDYEHEIALAVPSSGDVTQEEKCDNNQHWFLDSGCSRHMTPSKHEFEKYIELKHPVSVGLADESNILGYGIGNIKIKLFDGNELVPVVIKNVLFVPKLKRKLLSITDITDRGSSVTFKEKSCTLKMKDKTFLFGQRHGKLWRLYCQREQCFLSSAECFYAKETSLNLWHQRYGHLSHGNLDILNKKNMVEGIGTLDFKNDPKEICEGCVMGKQTRLPFPKKSSRITTKPLELIHSDVCGPISVESIGGSRYFITFIDNYSRFVVTYAMKTKDEALDKFKQYVAMAETKFESRVKKIRNDNGGEYVSKVFDDYLKERGTLDERTVPFTPEQNGISERMNRTLMEKV